MLNVITIFMNCFTSILDLIGDFAKESGIAGFFISDGWKNLIMIVIALVLLYFAIFKKAEPYLLIPIAFGVLLVNLPFSNIWIAS